MKRQKRDNAMEMGLQGLIEKLGRGAMHLPDPFEKGWDTLDDANRGGLLKYVLKPRFYVLVNMLCEITDRITETAKTYKPENKICKEVSGYDSLYELYAALERDGLPFEIYDATKDYMWEDDVLLSARMLNHDLRNVEAWIRGYTFSIGEFTKGSDDIDAKMLNDAMSGLPKLVDDLPFAKGVGATMAYLATGGNSKYSFEIPVHGIERILRKRKGTNTLSHIKNSANAVAIKSQHLISVYQFAKNAKKYSGVFDVNISDEGGYRVYSVRDYGNGICNRDGSPLAPEYFGQLFREYTTTGTGYGLRFVEALAKLDGGYAGFVTKTEGNPAIRYDTKSNRGYDDESVKVNGSEFSLWIPKHNAAV